MAIPQGRGLSEQEIKDLKVEINKQIAAGKLADVGITQPLAVDGKLDDLATQRAIRGITAEIQTHLSGNARQIGIAPLTVTGQWDSQTAQAVSAAGQKVSELTQSPFGAVLVKPETRAQVALMGQFADAMNGMNTEQLLTVQNKRPAPVMAAAANPAPPPKPAAPQQAQAQSQTQPEQRPAGQQTPVQPAAQQGEPPPEQAGLPAPSGQKLASFFDKLPSLLAQGDLMGLIGAFLMAFMPPQIAQALGMGGGPDAAQTASPTQKTFEDLYSRAMVSVGNDPVALKQEITRKLDEMTGPNGAVKFDSEADKQKFLSSVDQAITAAQQPGAGPAAFASTILQKAQEGGVKMTMNAPASAAAPAATPPVQQVDTFSLPPGHKIEEEVRLLGPNDPKLKGLLTTFGVGESTAPVIRPELGNVLVQKVTRDGQPEAFALTQNGVTQYAVPAEGAPSKFWDAAKPQSQQPQVAAQAAPVRPAAMALG